MQQQLHIRLLMTKLLLRQLTPRLRVSTSPLNHQLNHRLNHQLMHRLICPLILLPLVLSPTRELTRWLIRLVLQTDPKQRWIWPRYQLLPAGRGRHCPA
mmetsp:Transcript_44042/g.102831  ORF Transcript_44042/g.102831 Transcript_44042/m.102831 type:complete len:99 (-) Transcript_44042:347-643(-)